MGLPSLIGLLLYNWLQPPIEPPPAHGSGWDCTNVVSLAMLSDASAIGKKRETRFLAGGRHSPGALKAAPFLLLCELPFGIEGLQEQVAPAARTSLNPNSRLMATGEILHGLTPV